jgi:hypothetical protein
VVIVLVSLSVSGWVIFSVVNHGSGEVGRFGGSSSMMGGSSVGFTLTR